MYCTLARLTPYHDPKQQTCLNCCQGRSAVPERDEFSIRNVMLQQDDSAYVDGHIAFLSMAVPHTLMSSPSLISAEGVIAHAAAAKCCLHQALFLSCMSDWVQAMHGDDDQSQPRS